MELFFTTLLCLFLSSIFLSLCLLFRNSNSSSAAPLPPGKIGWPIIGESFQFLSTGRKGHPEKFILDRMSKFSSTIFRTHLFCEPMVVLCGPAGNKFLFSNENKLVRAWWPKSVDKIFPNPYAKTSSQDAAIKMRSMLPNFLKAEALRRYIPVMDHIAGRHFANGWENNKEVSVFALTKKYTFWLACRLFISVEDPDQVRNYVVPFESLTAGVFSMPIDLPGTPFRKAIQASEYIRKELLSVIRQRKIDLANGKASPTQDILSHMLLTSDEKGKFMDELDIASRILGLLIGGQDTTSSACTFIIKYLAEHPHVYDAVYKEQMEIANSKGEGELLSWEDLNKMKLSWNVACEVLRLVPPFQGSFREAITDFMYNGFSVPKGWKLFWSVHSTHKNPEYFPEPEKFNPWRFEGSGPAAYTFVPFGGGPRMCPGKEYARQAILVFMHHVVKRFRWEIIIGNEKIVVDPVSVPEKGLPVRLFPHHKK